MVSLYKNYIKNLHINSNEKITDNSIYLLNEKELKFIQKEYFNSLFQAGILGVLGVFLYYLPIYKYSFFSTVFTFTIYNKTISLAFYDIALCLVLTILEIYFLTLIHLRMTHNIAVYSGFINYENKSKNIDKLEQIATGKINKEITHFGLNPYQDTNKWLLLLINILIKLKGFLANKAIRYLIKKFSGRYAVKYVLDFIGAPIYMLLNMYATHIIYKNAKAEIFGYQLITNYIDRLPKMHLEKKDEELIYHTLQLIAMSKRDFHSNHSLLTKKIISHFSIPIKKTHYFDDSFYKELELSKNTIQKICSEIFLLGLILDGHISINEKRKIKKLQNKTVFQYSVDAICKASKDFIKGKEITTIQFNNYV